MKTRIVLGICITLLLTGSLSAATRTFTGVVDQFWSNAGNWDAIPGENDKARVRSELPCILDYDAPVIQQYVGEGGTIGHLILIDGAQLSVRTWNIIGYNGGEPDARHTIEVLGGVLNGGHPDWPGNNGRFNVGREGYGHLIIDYNGRVNLLFQDMNVGYANGGDGIVDLRGGVLNCGTRTINLATHANGKAKLDFSGGVMTQAYSDDRLASINDHIADGTITAYGSVGTVLVETTEENVLVVKGLHPRNPVPEDGGIVTIPGNITLSWTVDEGTPVDVWFGTSEDLSTATKIIENKVMTSIEVKVDSKQRYYWAVDTYAPGAADPNWGPIFDFVVDNKPPEVKAGDDVTTWLDNGSAEVYISATVEDSDPTTSLWTVLSEPNDPNNPDAVITDPSAEDTSITLSALGEYVLQLEASDGEYSGSDTMTINVFADSCLAAQSLPGFVAIPGDINLDCVVDQADIDLLLEQWLNCNGQDCPDIEPVDPNIP